MKKKIVIKGKVGRRMKINERMFISTLKESSMTHNSQNKEEPKSACYIHLNQGKVAIVDSEDLERILLYSWTWSGRYVRGNGMIKNVSLHRYILNYKGKKDVDHINGNTLDNQKKNLRICSHSKNIINSKKRSDNKSGYTGVYWYENKKRWRVQIVINKKTVTLGSFINKEDAIACRAKAVKKYYI